MEMPRTCKGWTNGGYFVCPLNVQRPHRWRICGRANQNIGADAAGTTRCSMKGAITETDQCQNHSDFDTDSQQAQERAHGPVAKICHYELILQSPFS